MKSTSIFGSVQVFAIVIGIIRSKFIAVLLGPTGMGIAGLLASTSGLIAGLTNFGLATSAIKDISVACSTGNIIRISTIATVFRRLMWLTGLLGAIVMLLFSKWLSHLTFGNEDYTWAFIWISITLLLNQVSNGQSVLLRGMRQIGYMAKSGMIGSTLGLFTTVPLYYFFGINGIVPGIIISSVTSLLLTWYYVHKLKIQSVYVSNARSFAESKGMFKMGFMVSLSGLITIGASYIVRIFISNNGGVNQVGLYNAGFAIINTYVGMVFTAMSTDYYPRLASVAFNNEKCKVVINQQAEIAVLILAPIIMIFLIFINWVVIILYSTKFIEINEMILYAAIGMLFKAASWSIAFIFLAKGTSKLFFWNELITNIYLLSLNILGYKYWGLSGLGISFLIAYILYLVQVFTVAKIKYSFDFTRSFYKLFTVQLLISIACFLIVHFMAKSYSYLIGLLLITISTLYSYKELDKRLDIRSLIRLIRR